MKRIQSKGIIVQLRCLFTATLPYHQTALAITLALFYPFLTEWALRNGLNNINH